jgi:hypothetical protein
MKGLAHFMELWSYPETSVKEDSGVWKVKYRLKFTSVLIDDRLADKSFSAGQEHNVTGRLFIHSVTMNTYPMPCSDPGNGRMVLDKQPKPLLL